MARKKDSQFFDSLYLNDSTYIDYLQRMKKICLSMFEWVNLPTSMDSRFLEKTLFEDGHASLLYDPDYGYINTKCACNGYLNIYDTPTQLNCFSHLFRVDRLVFNGVFTKDTNRLKECVYVRNNWEATPTFATIQLFAYRMYLAQRSCDVNVMATRTPVLLLGTEKQKLTLENLYNKYNGNQPFIFGDSDIISNDMLKAVSTQAPYVTDKLCEYKKEIWNEFLTFIGVNNIDVEKKERLISGESNSNNEVINLNLQSYLAPRKEACKQFNTLFGLTGDKAIDVRIRSDLFNVIKSQESIVTDYNNNGIEDTLEEGVLDE
jgi:hypothetical protein